MSSAQPTASDRKSVPVAYGLPCADCGTYYASQQAKCPTCGSVKRGPFSGSGRQVPRSQTAQVAPLGATPIASATERLYCRLAYGLPCAKCGCYYGSELKQCPTCHSAQRGAPIFGPQPVRTSVSAAISASISRGDAFRGLGLPCADCGSYYSGDVAACISCGSKKRGPFGTTQRLGPTLVVSEKNVASPVRGATRVAKIGLPCAKCHTYYDADRDACPSCGNGERRRIAATLSSSEVVVSPILGAEPEAAALLPLPQFAERAASLASEIAELLAKKLSEPDVSMATAPPATPEGMASDVQLAAPEEVAASGPVGAAQAPVPAGLPTETAEALLQETAVIQPALVAAGLPAPAAPTASAVEVATEAPATRAEQAPFLAFDLAPFAPVAPQQYFVVETEPSILNDPDSLSAAIGRAVDKAMRSLRILPALEPVSAETLTPPAASSISEETMAAVVAPPASALDASAMPTEVTTEDATSSSLEAALLEPAAPAEVAIAQVPEHIPAASDPTPRADAAGSVAEAEVPLSTLEAGPAIEALALFPMLIAPSHPEPETVTQSSKPVSPVEPTEAAEISPPEPDPILVATEHPVAESVLMPSIPEPVWLDCPTCHASYDGALATCPACTEGVALETPVVASDAHAEVVLAAQPETAVAAVRCPICDTPYPAATETCPGCLQTARSSAVLLTPAAKAVDQAYEAVTATSPIADAFARMPSDDSMTLIDAVDFFEALTRQLRA